ncbi:hypothetical protein SmJEL517_g00443 [Synchytrium microbalum]|uniref:Uncharacterized protein n=1 Tax=Synchytrium microbalum TaxID=1806994 RepID=A0A507CDQ8_9FUNG|nr:uncharacterized protein SmJEL517_g00443 [Synchytrium microbalum]TPX37752.1 hypothetical protein SmJEL517_g00443 [Synchytrium microbalum]
MLLDEQKRTITHLNVLLLGPAHVGKSSLIQSLLSGQPAYSTCAANINTGNVNQQQGNRSTAGTRYGPYLAPYDPTVEDSHILQYILPPGSLGLGLHRNATSSLLPTTPTSTPNDGPHRIILTLSDVGGHPYYSGIWASAIAAADAFMLVYDVGDKKSLDRMWPFIKMIAETKGIKPQELAILMVGNMVDTCATLDENNPGKRIRQVTPKMGQSLAEVLEVGWRETTARAPHAVASAFKSLIAECQIRVASLAKSAISARNSEIFQEKQSNHHQGTLHLRRPSEMSVASRIVGRSISSSRTSSDVYTPLSRDSMASTIMSRDTLLSRSGLGSWGMSHASAGSPYMGQSVVSDRSSNGGGIATLGGGSPSAQASMYGSIAPSPIITPNKMLPPIPRELGTPHSTSVITASSTASEASCMPSPALGNIVLMDALILPPAAPNSIRSKRDLVFAEWKAYKRRTAHHMESVIAEEEQEADDTAYAEGSSTEWEEELSSAFEDSGSTIGAPSRPSSLPQPLYLHPLSLLQQERRPSLPENYTNTPPRSTSLNQPTSYHSSSSSTTTTTTTRRSTRPSLERMDSGVVLRNSRDSSNKHISLSSSLLPPPAPPVKKVIESSLQKQLDDLLGELSAFETESTRLAS